MNDWAYFLICWGVIHIERTVKQDRHSPDMVQMPITKQEDKLLEIMRKLDYGEIRIVVKNSEIVQIEEKKSFKL